MTKGPSDPTHPPAIVELGARTGTSLAPASRGAQALADLLASSDWQVASSEWPAYCRYVLECIDGELVFRQPEIDAIVEDAIDEAYDNRPPAGRRIIKMPS